MNILRNSIINKIVYLSLGALCLFPIMSPPFALFLGIVVAQLLEHPYPKLNKKLTKYLLQISVVGLGFGINLQTALKAGSEGLIFTIISISTTILIGYLLGKFLKVDKVISYLISGGTAICGGSAIAALTPIVKANDKQVSIALGTIFILNSFALFIFPLIGHYFKLSQSDFGIWCAIAIHDTSSVVGAATMYGSEALQIATTVKLMRALWIIPVAFISSLLFKSKDSKINIPYFIGYFILAIVINSYYPLVQKINYIIVDISKSLLTLTLFLIGTSLSRLALKAVGIKPIIQGMLLWILISVTSLIAILNF